MLGGLPADMKLKLIEPLRDLSRTRCGGLGGIWVCRMTLLSGSRFLGRGLR